MNHVTLYMYIDIICISRSGMKHLCRIIAAVFRLHTCGQVKHLRDNRSNQRANIVCCL